MLCCIDVLYFSAYGIFVLYFYACEILCYIFTRYGILCYIFPRVEFHAIFFRVWNALWYLVFSER